MPEKSVSDVIDDIGMGRFQYMLMIMTGVCFVRPAATTC